MQSIPEISPLTPYTAIMPLIFVITVSMAREGIEDLIRHKADKQTNKQEFKVLVDGKWTSVRADKLQVGDIVVTNQDETLPADMIIMSTSNEEGICYV